MELRLPFVSFEVHRSRVTVARDGSHSLSLSALCSAVARLYPTSEDFTRRGARLVRTPARMHARTHARRCCVIGATPRKPPTRRSSRANRWSRPRTSCKPACKLSVIDLSGKLPGKPLKCPSSGKTRSAAGQRAGTGVGWEEVASRTRSNHFEASGRLYLYFYLHRRNCTRARQRRHYRYVRIARVVRDDRGKCGRDGSIPQRMVMKYRLAERGRERGGHFCVAADRNADISVSVLIIYFTLYLLMMTEYALVAQIFAYDIIACLE